MLPKMSDKPEERLLRTMGILGSMSAAAIKSSYRELYALMSAPMGRLHSPQLLICSLNFVEIKALQVAAAWDEAGTILNREARTMARGRAGCDRWRPTQRTY